MSYKKGMGKPRLFPLHTLYHKEIYIFEGEMDTLLALNSGLNAITTTGGAGGWRRKFSHLFKDKIVYICMDNDDAGQDGAKRTAKELQGIASKIYNIIIPKKLGKDFTDYIDKIPIEGFLNLVSLSREIRESDLSQIKKRRDFEEFAQEETMVASITPGKDTLHIIVKIAPSSEVRFQ